jgi:hypothetical protein
MPRYFFNIHHDRSSIDTVGEELPDEFANPLYVIHVSAEQPK